ncbi:hypothetical protein ABID39_001348 [Bartonella japonica]|uniref:ABC transporter permease n=1 Tax=Bartonella japonica TaxID=357761 RepID=A0ABV2FPZ2_9HYPH
MFKVFRNRLCPYIFTAFILYLAQTIESYAGIVQAQFQERGAVVALEKNTMMPTVDIAVVRDIERKDGLAFVKSGKASLFTLVWDTVSVISLLASLATGSILGGVISFVGLLL